MILEKKNNLWLFVGVLLACFVVSAGARYQQFETWKKTPAAYFVGERPMMTTVDAPYWLRLAREYNEGVYGQTNGLHGYPEYTETFREMVSPPPSKKFRHLPPTSSTSSTSSLSSPSSETPEIRYRDVPLLSFLIAHLAPFFNYNYYLTGTLLIPVLASLFILPLGLYFFRIGMSVSGLLGGLIGTFSWIYYVRSSIGRIDTDMLNLFFPVLAALLILLASLAKTERSVLLYSVGTGLSLFLFQWWYGKEGFTLAYFAVLVFSLFVQKIRLRTILLSALLYVLCVQPTTFVGERAMNTIRAQFDNYFFITELNKLGGADSLSRYQTLVVIDKGKTPATFPNTFTTITEAEHVPMDDVFRRVLSNTTIDKVGIIAFFALAVFRWRVLMLLAPMLALGLLSFQSSNRFIMYLAPFIGIGLGWLLQLGVESIFILITKNIHHREVNEGTKALRHKSNEGDGSFWASFYSLVAGTHFESTTEDRENKVKGVRNKVKGERLKVKGSLWAKIISWLSMDEDENGLAVKLKEGTEALRHKGNEGTNVDWWNWVRQVVLYLGLGVFFWLISGQTEISYVPGPSIHPRVYETFLEVKKLVPEDSALLTWWDYGYAITDATGLATFHDGGRQRSSKTYFIARSLISHDPEELYDITQYLSTDGNLGIAVNNTSPEALLEAVRNPQLKPWNPIYLFFTADMTQKYWSFSTLGSWDLVKGGSQPNGYQNLTCNKITNEEMNCRGKKIDLKAGKIDNRVALRRLVFIRDGQVFREQKFGHAQGYTLQIIVVGQRIVGVQLIDEMVFRSNYNQMFLLGRYREDLYEETYNAFPFSRLYRIKF